MVAGGHVVAVVGQTLVGLDAGTGEPRWEERVSAPLAGPPVATGRGIRLALTDGSVLAVDAATGTTQAQLILGDPIVAGPWVVGDAIYVATATSSGSTVLVAISRVPQARPTVSPPAIVDRP